MKKEKEELIDRRGRGVEEKVEGRFWRESCRDEDPPRPGLCVWRWAAVDGTPPSPPPSPPFPSHSPCPTTSVSNVPLDGWTCNQFE